MRLEYCPMCERPFKRIQDYPLIYVASVTTLTPPEIPSRIPHWSSDRFTRLPTTHAFKKQLPPEVAQYFDAHPNEEQLIHSDSYIYETIAETRRYQENMARFSGRFKDPELIDEREYLGRFNWSNTVKNILETNTPLKDYLESLKILVNHEIATSQLFPDWKRNRIVGRDFGYIIPDNNDYVLMINLTEPGPELEEGMNYNEVETRRKEYAERKKTADLLQADIGLWTHGPNLGSAGGPTFQMITSLGRIEYEGRVKVKA